MLYYRIHGENTSITKRSLQCDAGKKMILEHLMPHFKFNFNDYEFEMHNKVSQWEEKYFNQPDKLKELNDWFLKLLKYNDGFYGENELYKTLSYWWVYVCVKSKQYKYIFGGYDFKLNRKIFKKIVFEYFLRRIIFYFFNQ